MSSVRKRLGATTVTASADTSLYVVPANTETIVSTILICNRGTTSAAYRVAHVDGDISAVASEDYIVYDATVPANDSVPLTIGITMQATHSLLVRSSSANVSFIAWGTETTASANPSDIGRTIVGGRLERASDSYLEWQPYINGSIGIYNGSAWSLVTPSSNPSLQNTANDLDNNALTYDYNYDIFAEWVSSSSFYLRAKKWSGDTTRGFTLYRHEGVLVLDNTANGVKRRFLGTVRLRNDSGAKFTDTEARRFVSNYYNAVSKKLYYTADATGGTFQSSSWGLWTNWTSPGIGFVTCVSRFLDSLGRGNAGTSSGNLAPQYTIYLDGSIVGLMEQNAYVASNYTKSLELAIYRETVNEGYHYLDFYRKQHTTGTGSSDQWDAHILGHTLF
jgi:hypothetical protein